MRSRSAVVQSDHISANILRCDIGVAGTSEAGSVGGAKKKNARSHNTQYSTQVVCTLIHFPCSVYVSAPEGGIAGGEGAFDKQEKRKMKILI